MAFFRNRDIDEPRTRPGANPLRPSQDSTGLGISHQGLLARRSLLDFWIAMLLTGTSLIWHPKSRVASRAKTRSSSSLCCEAMAVAAGERTSPILPLTDPNSLALLIQSWRGVTGRRANIYSFVYWGEILYSCANRVQLKQVVRGIIPQRGSSHAAKEELRKTKGEKDTENLSSWRSSRFVALEEGDMASAGL